MTARGSSPTVREGSCSIEISPPEPRRQNTSSIPRLCRLMCGKAMPFRLIFFQYEEAMPPKFAEAQPLPCRACHGKAEPFRTSNGKAAKLTKLH